MTEYTTTKGPWATVKLSTVATIIVGATHLACHRAAITTSEQAVDEVQTVKRKWTDSTGIKGVSLETKHFKIYVTSRDSELVDFLPGYLEAAYKQYESLLPPSKYPPLYSGRLHTYLLDNRQEWEKFVESRYPSRSALYKRISAGGFSEGDTCVVYDIGRSATLSVLAHEGWHQYVASRHCEGLPAWLNEGLATYCEAVEFRKDVPHFTPERNSYRMNHLCDAIATESTIPLEKLLATNAGEMIQGNRNDKTGTYYAQVWALVLYLRQGSQSLPPGGFEQMMLDIANRKFEHKCNAARASAPEPSKVSFGESAFRAYFPLFLRNREYFETELNTFMQSLCWKP